MVCIICSLTARISVDSYDDISGETTRTGLAFCTPECLASGIEDHQERVI